MKKLVANILILVLCIACSPGVAAAVNSVTINPVSLLVGVPNLQYEVAFDDKDSFTFSGSLVAFEMEDWQLSGGGLEIGTRTYFGGHAPRGFFLGTSVGGAFINTTYDDGWASTSGTGAIATGSVTAGVKLIGGSGLTGEIAAGLSVAMGTVTAGSQTTKVRGANPGVSLAIGYSW